MKLEVELDTTEVRQAFNRLLKSTRDTGPLMKNIGEMLLNSTRDRFRNEQDPDGKAWEPLSEVTKGRKKNVDKVLTERGHLSGSINYRSGDGFIEIGSTRIYAGTHQFGASRGALGTGSFKTRAGTFPVPWGDIPARPFLGLSAGDRLAINNAVADYLERQLPPGALR